MFHKLAGPENVETITCPLPDDGGTEGPERDAGAGRREARSDDWLS